MQIEETFHTVQNGGCRGELEENMNRVQKNKLHIHLLYTVCRTIDVN